MTCRRTRSGATVHGAGCKCEPEPTRVTTTVRVRAYDVIARAVDEGCAAGVRRAHKHSADPGEAAIAGECARAVMDALAEVLSFGDET